MVTVSSNGYNRGNSAEISIDGTPIKMDKNENGHDRGLHVVSINELTGIVEHAKVFDTHKSSKVFETFIKNQLNIPPGRIVVAACKDDFMTQLSKRGKRWFSSQMGSDQIYNINYKCGFVFIGKMLCKREFKPFEKVGLC